MSAAAGECTCPANAFAVARGDETVMRPFAKLQDRNRQLMLKVIRNGTVPLNIHHFLLVVTTSLSCTYCKTSGQRILIKGHITCRAVIED